MYSFSQLFLLITQVETIGDAYMVVGGLPKPCDNHAEKVAHMACSMMEASRKVLSPVDKTPLKVLDVICTNYTYDNSRDRTFVS